MKKLIYSIVLTFVWSILFISCIEEEVKPSADGLPVEKIERA